jgi:mannose-6-phosphate isomerase-like protein (cupin superfamily)
VTGADRIGQDAGVGAVVHGPGGGERHSAGQSEILIKATGDDTGGSLYLGEITLAPGFPGPPPHRHERLHDMFYVLEGTLTMRLGDETREVGPGTFVCVPPGVVHTFANPSDAPVRLLNLNTPSGFEEYMRALADAAREGPLTSEAIGRIASRYDFIPA